MRSASCGHRLNSSMKQVAESSGHSCTSVLMCNVTDYHHVKGGGCSSTREAFFDVLASAWPAQMSARSLHALEDNHSACLRVRKCTMIRSKASGVAGGVLSKHKEHAGYLGVAGYFAGEPHSETPAQSTGLLRPFLDAHPFLKSGLPIWQAAAGAATAQNTSGITPVGAPVSVNFSRSSWGATMSP